MASLIDSSVWVALFLDFDTQHTRASRLLSRLKGRIHLPYCVTNEVVTILTYKHSKQQADRFIAFIEGNRDIILQEDNIVDELVFFKTLQTRISLTDAALLLFSRNLKVKIITFDKQLERLSKRG